MYKNFLILFISAAAGAAAVEPADLQLVLKGAKPGMNLQAFTAAHPDAKSESGAPSTTPLGPEVRDASVEESYERDPLFALACWASYGFRDGKLREMLVQWNGDRTTVAQLRESFLQLCLQQEGTDFRREAMRANPNDKDSPLFPVLLWEKTDHVILASAALDADGKENPRGTFTYAVFPARDEAVVKMLVGKTLTADQLGAVFTGINLQSAPAALEPATK